MIIPNWDSSDAELAAHVGQSGLAVGGGHDVTPEDRSLYLGVPFKIKAHMGSLSFACFEVTSFTKYMSRENRSWISTDTIGNFK